MRVVVAASRCRRIPHLDKKWRRSAETPLREQVQLRRRGEGLEFVAVLLAAVALADGAFGGEFAVFEVAEGDFGAVLHVRGHTGQAGGEFGQFMAMRCEMGLGADLVVQALDNGPRK